MLAKNMMGHPQDQHHLYEKTKKGKKRGIKGKSKGKGESK